MMRLILLFSLLCAEASLASIATPYDRSVVVGHVGVVSPFVPATALLSAEGVKASRVWQGGVAVELTPQNLQLSTGAFVGYRPFGDSDSLLQLRGAAGLFPFAATGSSFRAGGALRTTLQGELAWQQFRVSSGPELAVSAAWLPQTSVLGTAGWTTACVWTVSERFLVTGEANGGLSSAVSGLVGLTGRLVLGVGYAF